MMEQAQQTGMDRRESVRVPAEVRVRRPGSGPFVTSMGDVSLGGARATSAQPIREERLEVAVPLYGQDRELRVTGDVIRVRRKGGTYQAHIKFGELAYQDEVAVARFLDRSKKR